MDGWKVGDRVAVGSLKVPQGRRGPRGRVLREPAHGTVAGFSEPGKPEGVRVEFDAPVNGQTWCMATPGELTLIEPAVP